MNPFEQYPPGSDAAIDAGCECAVQDNHHGKGCGFMLDGKPTWWVNQECPLHGVKEVEG